ncbi:MAG: response regulator [Candidatus Marinimicrobia bacterium]|nr:response regulator [Candidatus Neomarinimicrobiota bacterium]
MNKYQFIFDKITDSILLCESDYSISESNRAAEVVLGQGDKLTGQKCYEVIRSLDHPCLDCPLSDSLKSGTIIPLVKFDDRFGEFFEERTYPVINAEGQIESFIITWKNVTKSREIEEKSAQLKKLSALGQISSGVAHDFNNVLTVVLGRIQLLKKQTLDPLILNSLDMIEKSALDGASKVRKIQEFSRPKEGRLDEVIDLNKLLQEVLEITRPKWDIAAKVKGILIEPILDLEKNVYIYGDSSDLRNAFTNIIFNSVDAMPEGGILSIKTGCRINQVAIEFKDTGTGMTEEVREKIFDPFFSTKGVLGTGLGMSEVWGIIKRHSGQITINSKVGKGTTIRLLLTLATKPTAKPPDSKSNQIVPCNIMVVDDEEYILEIMKELLAELGHCVTTFSSALTALDNFKKNQYDIVLTDLGMPDMNGLEMATKIKDINPKTLVIMMSGWGLNLDENNTRNIVDYIINKPFSVEKIIYIISESTAKIKHLSGK